MRVAGIDCLFGCFANVGRRREVWFAECEFEDIDALCSQFAGFAGGCNGRGWLELIDELRRVHESDRDEVSKAGNL